MNFRFNIKNFREKFILTIALDWGRRGGCSAAEFVPIAETAFPRLTGINEWEFDFEPQAQNALRDFKGWLKAREDAANERRRKSYEENNPFIQEYKNACTQLKTN